MKIKLNTDLNFKASFVENRTIQRINTTNLTYSPTTASIVEIDPQNSMDINAIYSTVKKWGNKYLYGYQMCSNLLLLRDGELSPDVNKVYAITLQQDKFNELNSNMILGMAQTTKIDQGDIELDYLLAKPKSSYLNGTQKFKHIGKSIIDMLKNKPNIQSILVKASYEAATFYEKIGFKVIDPDRLWYLFKK